MSTYIRAHRKALLAALAAVLILFFPSATVDEVVSIVGAFLILIVPNDQAAVARIYRK